MIIERSGMEWNDVRRSNARITDWFGYYSSTFIFVAGAGAGMTRSARMEETSTNEFKSIKQYSKLISIEHTGMKQVAWHFEDLEYLKIVNIQ